MSEPHARIEAEALTHESMWRDMRRFVARAFVALGRRTPS